MTVIQCPTCGRKLTPKEIAGGICQACGELIGAGEVAS